MLSRKAMVSSKIEKAQGFTLSMSAATPTSGNSHRPPSLALQSAAVPALPNLNSATVTASKRPAATMSVSLRSMASRLDIGGETDL